MTKPKQPALRIDADEGQVLHVTWGRSGKRAIVSISGPQYIQPQQCTLTTDDVAELSRFLDEGPDEP
ncbi:hypothetical protein OJ997_02005 [Solirubrobacter phytolaccae]|uniref:Uncharacterized protein n=1 Tax=Solirubrobacter phytolaccae TaxID=1404360 RepID=A0A9X3N3I8_9ACTN|nr:hypothetical protein [Solirubrobacter phytolaccae]MDA0179053.1 hypothetical protein [Solirubrobacter phytolaccae]